MSRVLFTLDAAGHMVPATDEGAWREWYADLDRRTVAKATLPTATVVTTFLGLDARTLSEPVDSPRPLYFQSLVYGHDGAALDCRYSETRMAALAEHERLAAQLRGKHAD